MKDIKVAIVSSIISKQNIYPEVCLVMATSEV